MKIDKNKTPDESSDEPLVHNGGLNPLDHPELVFGLVGPSGADLPLLTNALRKNLNTLNYAVEEIRLSKIIEKFLNQANKHTFEDERISHLMNLGTEIREKSERGDAIALLAIKEIHQIRQLNPDRGSQKTAYILHSLKHPDEIRTLRNVYGAGFYTISAYCPREMRVDALAERIAKSRDEDIGLHRWRAEQLIQRDESETGKSLGQDVADAFPLADLFVDCRSKDAVFKNVRRFIQLLFSHPYHTPTKDEYGMFHAKSAALRSSDLGRQVGAVIATEHADIIAVGCNDVPRAHGGLYWAGDDPDERDFRVGHDPMHKQKEQILSEIIDRLADASLLDNSKFNNKSELVQELVAGTKKKVLKGLQVMNLLEFGRSVHAEMAALMDAARRGVSVQGATLYSTTFPCHLCARHIVAAGIKRVVYIEPYPKSRAKQLHKDSISVDEKGHNPSKVNFQAFTGIAPRQYLDMFEAAIDRKDTMGKAVEWSELQKKPRFVRFMNTYLQIETMIIAQYVAEIAKKMNICLTDDPNQESVNG